LSKKTTPRSGEQLDGWEHVLVTRVNWAIGRQNVTVALMLSTVIGALSILRIGGEGAPYVFMLFVGLVLFEFWVVFNFESSIIFYQLELGDVRFDWKISESSLIWWWFNKDGKINKLFFSLTELLIIAGFYVAYLFLH
jgi:hypothetical protein